MSQRIDLRSDIIHQPTSILHGISIESITGLINGNRSGIDARHTLWDDPGYRHKFYNHVGRLQYLNQLLPQILALERTRVPAGVNMIRYDLRKSTEFGNNMMYLCVLLDRLEQEGQMCRFDYRYVEGQTCDPSLIRLSMTEHLVRMLFWSYELRRGTHVSVSSGIYGSGSHVISYQNEYLMKDGGYVSKETFFQDFLAPGIKYPQAAYQEGMWLGGGGGRKRKTLRRHRRQIRSP